MKRTIRILTGAVLLALAPLAPAQTAPATEVEVQMEVVGAVATNAGQTNVATRMASNFSNLAGSEENALALVQALRNGSDVTITTTTTTPPTGTATTPTVTTTTATYSPPTGQMGWGNVKIALALAQDALLRAGITQPTPEQLQAALNGGEVTNLDGTVVTLDGVLQMRADGMGWGEIAHAGGTKLGPVVSKIKATNAELLRQNSGETATTTTATARTAKVARTDVTMKVKGPSKGVTTAAGGTAATTKVKGPSKGVTAGTGAGATQSVRGISTASGATSGTPAASRGLVTAGGSIAGSTPRGNAYGRGVVSATGGGSVATSGVTTNRGGGHGVVTATGTSAGSGVTTAHGNRDGGNNAGGRGNGRGPGKG